MSVVSANGSAVGQGNVVINGAFDVWQRGTSLTTTSAGAYGYIADRFRTLADKTVAFSQQTFAPGSAPVTTSVEPTYFLRADLSAGGSYLVIDALIEDARTLAGQTATLSFYMKSSVSGTIDGPSIIQNFGSGGSAGTETGGTLGTGVAAITSSWRRYTSTVNVPSIAGKTIGTGSYLAIRIRMDVSAVAKQVDIWGVQLDAGSVAAPFRRNSSNLQAELAACQRYFQQLNSPMLRGVIGQSGTVANRLGASLPVSMRAAPTISMTGTLQCYDGQNTTTFTGLTATYAMPGWIEVDSQGFTGGATLGAYRPALVYLWANGSVILNSEF